MGEYLLINNTAGTATGLTTSDVAIQQGTNVIKPSHNNVFEVIANIELITPAPAVAQTITYKIKLGSTTIYQQNYRIGTATSQTAQTIPISLRYTSGFVNGQAVGNLLNGGGTLTVTQVSTGTDATTTSQVKNLYVKGFD